MTRISQPERTRPGPESLDARPPSGPAGVASPPRSPSHAPSGLPPPLGTRRPPSLGGTVAPRAALPPIAAGGTPPLRGLPGRSGAGASGPAGDNVPLAQLPPVPRMRDGRSAWTNLWKGAGRREMFDALRLQHQKHEGQDVPGGQFLEKLAGLTGQAGAQAFTTRRSDVTRFIVQVPGADQPVHLLRRDADDGTLGDIVRLDTGSDAEVTQALEGIGERERAKVAREAGKAAGAPGDGAAAAKAPAATAAPPLGGSLPDVPASFFPKRAKTQARKKVCEPLLARHLAAGGAPKALSGFLEMAFKATASAPRLPSERPDIGHFLVPVKGFDEPLHVLTRVRKDGSLADFAIATPGDPNAAEREIAAMILTARKLAGREGGGAGEARVLIPLPRDLEDVHDAYRQRPGGNIDLAGRTFHTELCKWAHEAADTARPTRHKGIDRFTVEVPAYGKVELLGQRDKSGRVVSVQRLKSEAELEDKLKKMAEAALISNSARLGRQTGQVKKPNRRTAESRRLTTIWERMQGQLQDEFTAWKEQRVGRNKGGGSFVGHLEKLCIAAGGDTLVSDADKTVTRHRITPNEGGDAITLLRYVNAEGVATGMRVFDPARMTEDDAIATMSGFKKRSQLSRQRAAMSYTPQRVVAEDFAQPMEKRVTSAKAMRRALEAMLARQRTGAQDLLAGLEHEDELRTWFQHDGAPAPGRTGSSFWHLPGFDAQRERLVSLLTRLGQQGLVSGIPPTMTAALMAKVLKARADHPKAGSDELMQIAGVTSIVYHDYLDIKTGALRSDTRLRLLPGYNDHWADIRDALYRLGHAGQAAQLRGPSTDPAERLLYDIENEMYALQTALHAMRVLGMPRRQAARSAGLSNPAILRRLVDPQGQVRNLQLIASRLPRTPVAEAGDTSARSSSPLPRGSDAPAASGAAPAAPEASSRSALDSSPLLGSRLAAAVQRLNELADRQLVVRTVKGRGRKLFVVGLSATRHGGSAGAQSLRRMYAGHPELVRAPRSFDSERPRQTLRWLSTALKRWFPGGIEIQAYHDPVKNEIWVSSNVDNVNLALRRFLSSGGLVDRLAGFDGGGTARRMARDREHRHLSKLKHTLDDPSLLTNDAARTVLETMAAGRFRVPLSHELPKAGRSGINLHAERRIRNALLAETGKAPDPFDVTGTRRPCGICAKDLQLPPSARRGPIWPSASSRAGYDPAAVADDYARSGVPTFITQARDGRWTANHDTDSEAEPDLEQRPGKRKAAMPVEPPAKRQALDAAVSGGPITNKKRSQVDGLAQALPPRPAGPSRPAVASLQPGLSPRPGLSPVAAPAAHDVQMAALQEDALDAALLLGRRIDVPLPREQVAPLLQALLDEGSERFDAFRARLAADPRLQPTPEQQQEMRQFGELSLRLRRSAAALGLLPAQALPTAALPAGFKPPADGNWERPMLSLFTPGTASGARNICWFDTLAQLALDESRDLMGDMQPVDALAAELRATADRLGLTEAGAMADDDHGALQLIAHSLGLQVHVFLRQPSGEVALSPLQSVGAPDGKPVHVYSDDIHFTPMWPAWGPDGAR
jgi:hypothetical protein